VLTGAGGGTWDLRLGPDGGTGGSIPEVVIVAEGGAFCRLVANRASPRDVVLQVSGAASAASAVLAGAAALALD
jgi:pectate lyase